ncbi:MAG: histidinol-phosphate transaminase [Spirochaetia bacterium]|nr:histidinol-phosphate transaminase [Spirochaetia bacterium]
MKDFVLKNIREMEGYTPGEQINDPEIIKLNTNENPFPPSRKVKEALSNEISRNRLQLYPDPASYELRKAIASRFGRSEKNVIIGNGSDDVLTILFRTFLNHEAGFIIPWPTYSLYPVLAGIQNVPCFKVPLKKEWKINFPGILEELNRHSKNKMVIFANPNAPTGNFEEPNHVLSFVKSNPVLTLVDEAYISFGGKSLMPDAGTDDYPRLMACGTFSKSHSLAGQRIGYIVAHEDLIFEMDKARDSYNLSRLSQISALAALEDEEEYQKRFETIMQTRKFLSSELRKRGFDFSESLANFIFVSPPGLSRHEGNAAEKYYTFLKEKKILIRYFSETSTQNHVRITIGKKEEIEKLLEATDLFLKKFL